MITYNRNNLPIESQRILEELSKSCLVGDEYHESSKIKYRAKVVTKFAELDQKVDELINITSGHPELLALIAELKLKTQRLVFSVNPSELGE